jgi:hypothetical protein
MSVYIYRIDFYCFRKDVRGTMYRLPDSFTSNIIGFSSDEAIRTVKMEALKESYIAEPYSCNMLCQIDKFSAPVVSKIVNDMSKPIIRQQEQAKHQSEMDLQSLKSNIWRNSSL